MKWHFIGIGLATVAAITIYQNKNDSLTQVPHHEHDIVLHDIEHSWTGQHGQVQGEITSPKAKISSRNGIMEIESPKFYALDQKNIRWQVSADKGKAYETDSKLILSNHVVIRQESTPTTLLNTKTLTIFPKQHFASTHDAVVITQGDSRLEAKGMSIDFETGHITLKHQAQGRFHD